MGSEVSTYGDVYSYGILLLEMFTGKRPTDDMFIDGLHLHNFAKTAFPERVAEIADPVLLQELTPNNSQNQNSMTSHDQIQECLISIFHIGIACSSELPRERMNMGDVAAELHLVRDKFLGTGIRGHRHNIVGQYSNQVSGNKFFV